MDLKDKKILFLGDSITKGSGCTEIDEVYWKQLEKNTGATCVGYGIGGTRFAKQTEEGDIYEEYGNFCVRASQMDDEADIVVVFGGTNDYGHGDAPFGKIGDKTSDTFCGAVDYVINVLVNKYPEALIVFLTPTHRLGETGRTHNERGIRQDKTLEDYVNAEIAICAKYSIPVLDLFRVSGIQPEIDAVRERFLPDGLHPNKNGNARIASRLEGFLRKL